MAQVITNMALIDWVTISVTGEAYKRLRRWSVERKSKPYKEAKRRMGTVVYYGFEGDGFFWGEQENEGTIWGIFISQGHISHAYALEIWAMALGVDSKCTRIDYQITIAQPLNYDPFRFRGSLEKAMGQEVGIIGRRTKGMTVETYTREGVRYCRIYQKIIKSGKGAEDEYLLRFEMEYKGELARNLWRKPLNPSQALRGEIESMITNRGLSSRVLGDFMAYLNETGERARMVSKPSNTWLWILKTVTPAFDRIRNSDDWFERKELMLYLEDELSKFRDYEENQNNGLEED